MQMLR